MHKIFKLNQNVTRKMGIIVSLLLLILIFSILSPNFFSKRNMINILQQTSINGVVALGMTFVIIIGGIDLSVGSIVALVGMVMAQNLVGGMNVAVAIILGLVLGLFFGFVNGIVIAKLKLQPFLVTLGTMSIYRGLTLIISNGLPVRNLPKIFSHILNAWNAYIPVPIIILLVLTVICAYIIRYKKYGQHLFALGGNEEATRLSGINVDYVKILTYSLSGLFCAFAAVIFLGRLGAADPQAGNGYEMTAIASAAIGGASLMGGKGSIVGTIIGALILATLSNGLIILNVQSYYQTLAIGLIIILATILDRYSSK
jgi:ribose transport system permease protein